MTDRNLILDLAKLVISSAWVDGELSGEEVNALKDLLFNLEDVSAEDWTVLTMYMESPVSDAERGELLERVTQAIRSSADKAFAVKVLEELFRCDGKITAEEQQLMAEFRGEISEVATGMFSGMSRALKSAIGQRQEAVRASSLREHDSGDYLRNTIYYDLMRRQADSSVVIERPEPELRKLCLAVGLLSHIANVDAVISQSERETMQGVLAEDWQLSDEEAELLVDISCDRTTRGLDYYRLSHGFYECTVPEERRNFLKTLFRIANAANKTDLAEIEEIRGIAVSLKLSHKDFIDAKLTVPRADRNGL